MTKALFVTGLIVLSLPLVACSDGKFSSDDEMIAKDKASASADPDGKASSDGKSSDGASGISQPDGKISGDDEKNLAGCEKAWGKDVPARTDSNVRVIHSSISVGSSAPVVSDLKKTDKPEFVLIYSSIAVGGAPEWNLMNPNGYYCIVSSINVGAVITVNLDKSAHIAEPKAAIQVGSQVDENIALSSINVGSRIKVNRK